MKTLVRVIEVITDEFQSKVSEIVKFQGDVDELSEKFPPSAVWGADSLSHSEIEDGWIRFDYRFEMQAENAEWVPCADPRNRDHVSDSFYKLEAEIKRENKRLFPGDYACSEEDEGNYYDDWYDTTDDIDV